MARLFSQFQAGTIHVSEFYHIALCKNEQNACKEGIVGGRLFIGALKLISLSGYSSIIVALSLPIRYLTQN